MRFALSVLLLIVLVQVASAVVFNVNRRWFVGGNFSSVLNNSTSSSVAANNIAYYDGTAWNTMNGGTNGAVNSVYADLCLNVYIGGQFTTAGKNATGAVAMWKYGNSGWSSLGNGFSLSGANDVVNSVFADCGALPSLSGCTCTLYVGGSFYFTGTSDGTPAVNIASYNTKSGQWSAMGGAAASGFAYDATGKTGVKTLYTKLGSGRVYIGGNFLGLFKYYDGAAFSSNLITTNTASNPSVNSIAYDTNVLTTDNIYIGGNFQLPSSDSSTPCINVCNYNHKTGAWGAVGSGNPVPNSPSSGSVNGVSYNGNGLFAVGSFGSGVYTNLAYHSDGSSSWTTGANNLPSVFPGQGNSGNLTGLYACTTTDVSCPSNGLAVVGSISATTPYVGYYDPSNGWTSFGGGIPSGKVNTVYSKYWASAPRAVVDIIVLISCVVLGLLLL